VASACYRAFEGSRTNPERRIKESDGQVSHPSARVHGSADLELDISAGLRRTMRLPSEPQHVIDGRRERGIGILIHSPSRFVAPLNCARRPAGTVAFAGPAKMSLPLAVAR
jgi:hypothetical protein